MTRHDGPSESECLLTRRRDTKLMRHDGRVMTDHVRQISDIPDIAAGSPRDLFDLKFRLNKIYVGQVHRTHTMTRSSRVSATHVDHETLFIVPCPRRLPRRCQLGCPHISMDTFWGHSAYYKVSTARCLVTNVLKT